MSISLSTCADTRRPAHVIPLRMKSRKSILTALLCCMACFLQPATAQEQVPACQPAPENLEARKAFSDAKFGIFLHWGIYSLFGQGEWYMNNACLNRSEYAKAADAFYPHRFNAGEWVKAFRQAGAKYICFTTRHHDGFSMWNTRASDFNIMNTPYGRDILKELADECHRQDLKLHLYYSHIDWTRDDYPAGRTGRATGKDPGKADWPHYFRFMNTQLRELLTGYGDIGAVWFDGWWDHDHDSIPFDWQLQEQYRLIHTLQPACLIGNNHHQTPFPGEDLQIFERDVPGENKAGLSGQAIGRLPLETCQTMNGMWGYKAVDMDYKSSSELIRLLVRTAAKGANLLLNIGPQPNGQLPELALERLHDMGEWLQHNGKAVYGTTAGNVALGDSVVSTRRGNKLYVHVLQPEIQHLDLTLPERVTEVKTFPDGESLRYLFQRTRLSMDLNVPDDIPDYIIEITLQ